MKIKNIFSTLLFYQVNLEVTVLDYDMLGGSDAIGKVIIVLES